MTARQLVAKLALLDLDCEVVMPDGLPVVQAYQIDSEAIVLSDVDSSDQPFLTACGYLQES